MTPGQRLYESAGIVRELGLPAWDQLTFDQRARWSAAALKQSLGEPPERVPWPEDEARKDSDRQWWHFIKQYRRWKRGQSSSRAD